MRWRRSTKSRKGSRRHRVILSLPLRGGWRTEGPSGGETTETEGGKPACSETPQTPYAEVKLWVHLRKLRTSGFHFRRQSPIGSYIVDFACLKRGIVVEADGGQHGLGMNAGHDRIRDAFLASQGFHVLRCWNSDIDRNLGRRSENDPDHVEGPTRPAFVGRRSPKGEG
ncbi:MAG TPA: endonuclease domain-containing protein [Nitrobacter sp.]|nr:endonuclease domain-containing protein [Nitrobacter sp.]